VPDADGLNGLVCPTSSTCYALGSEGAESNPPVYAEALVVPIVYGVVGIPIEVPGVSSLSAISCDPGTTNCVAVGEEGISTNFPFTEAAIVNLSGGAVSSVNFVPSVLDLEGVACGSASSCVAVGELDSSAGVLPISGGTPGTVQSVSGLYALSAVACESATDCWSAGTGPDGPQLVPISGGVAGSPAPASGVSSVFSLTCTTASLCYLTGSSASEGVILPIVSDVAQPVVDIPSVAAIEELSCPMVDQCDATAVGGLDDPASAYIAVDVLPTPPPTLSSVTLSGAGTGLTVTVTGSNLGDFQPVPSPLTPDACASGDTSYDYASGVLGFSDTSEGWSAGEPGDCVGLLVSSWSSDHVVLTLGAGYAYPLLAEGDSYAVTVLGNTLTATAAGVTDPAAAAVSAVTFSGTGLKTLVTVTGSGFGTRVPYHDPSSPLSCVKGDRSYTYDPGSFYFEDETQNWQAGEPGDCIGLTVVKWAPKKLEFQFGSDYPSVQAVTGGDSFEMGVLGTAYAGTAVAPSPSISSVSFSGTGAKLKITVLGSDFGSKPTDGVSRNCNAKDTSEDFAPGEISFSDETSGWTAGADGSCIGLFVKSWTAASVAFEFGTQYHFFTPVTAGDTYAVTVRNVTYTGTV
jgi:hypothetical protein